MFAIENIIGTDCCPAYHWCKHALCFYWL